MIVYMFRKTNPGRCDYMTLHIHEATRTAFKLDHALKDTIAWHFQKIYIISGNSRFNGEKASGNSLYPHHVSMFQVCLVLQQLPHHIDVALLSCRDQRRPAVLHI